MKIRQVAAQLYTLRDFCKTPAETAESLKKVRSIGYEAVQVSGVCAMPEAELKKMMDDNGLVCCATHEPSQQILDDPQAVSARLSRLGTRYTAYPYPGGIDFSNREHVTTLIRKLDAAGAVLRAAGQVLTYHNHGHEFIRHNGRTLLEEIYATSDPLNLQAEIDTYWVQFGGGDPVHWCEKMKGRLPLLHAKDYAFSMEYKPVFAEVGYGNLDFPAITKAAEKSGMEWFIVEQDTCPGDPFDSLRKSFEYVKSTLCS